MQNSSSGGDRNRNSNSRSRGGSRSGSRSEGGGDRNRRSGSRSGGDSRRDGGSRSESSSSRPPRGSRSFDNEPEIIRRSTAPKPTGFQKFIKIITFGFVDLAAKKPAPGKPAPKTSSNRSSSSSKSGDKPEKRERRAPLLVEPTTPRLYVGNLSYDATGEDLTTLFSDYGTVAEAAIVTQPGSDRSKGFAFVEMGSVEEAKAAAAALNDQDFQGRQMLVTGAKSEGRSEGERTPRAPRGEGREGGRSSEGRGRDGRSGEGRGRGERGRSGDRDLIEKPTRQVKPLEIEVVSSPSLTVINLSAEASEIDVTDLFAGIGTIQHREETAADGAVTKTVRVDLADTAEAQKAVELLDGKCFMGHQIRVTGAKGSSPAIAAAVEASEAVEAPGIVETPEAAGAPEVVEISETTVEPENHQA